MSKGIAVRINKRSRRLATREENNSWECITPYIIRPAVTYRYEAGKWDWGTVNIITI